MLWHSLDLKASQAQTRVIKPSKVYFIFLGKWKGFFSWKIFFIQHKSLKTSPLACRFEIVSQLSMPRGEDSWEVGLEDCSRSVGKRWKIWYRFSKDLWLTLGRCHNTEAEYESKEWRGLFCFPQSHRCHFQDWRIVSLSEFLARQWSVSHRFSHFEVHRRNMHRTFQC